MQKGTVKRTLPRLEVLKGFNPMEPMTRQTALRVASGVTVKSGQVVSRSWNSGASVYEWVLGLQAGQIPHFAFNDSTDFDVLEAGTLPALSSLGQYELQTAHFKSGDTYVAGAPLTPDGVTGNVKVTTLKSGEPIVGFVSRHHAPVDLHVGDYPADSSAVTATVIVFETTYLPNSVDAT